MTQATIIHIGGAGPVLFERSARAKHLNITVKPFKGVRVAVPRGLPFREAEQIARLKVDWIRTQLDRMRKLEQEYAKAPVVEVDRKEAGKILVGRLEAIAEKHGYCYNRVTLRSQKTRWGSCSFRNDISLNLKLVLLPAELRDYIILHELVHTRVKNHGKEFWAELTRVEPEARELARQVRLQGNRLLR